MGQIPPATSSHFVSPFQKHPEKPEPDEALPRMPAVKIQTQQQNIAFPQPAAELPAGTVTAGSPQLVPAHRPKMPLPGERGCTGGQGGARCGGGLEGGGAPGMSFAPWFSFPLLYSSFTAPKGLMSLLVCDFPDPYLF